MDYNTIIKTRYSNGIFVNSPEKTPDSIDPFVVFKKELKSLEPFFSIVCPIHNQEIQIAKNIESILNYTSEKPYELILIFDSCSDKTEINVLELFNTYKNKFPEILVSILCIRSETPLFETSSDNLGFICSRGKYILEIQADMEMTEPGYNMSLLRGFTVLRNVLGISGRCCHGLTNPEGIGKLGELIEQPLSPDIEKNILYISETCNRGPLLLDALKLKELGYLDERNYFLDNSDHDLFARAFAQKGWLCGYIPMEFKSPLENGSTRKPRNELNSRFYSYKKQVCKENGFLKQYIQSNPNPRYIVTLHL